MQTGLEPRSSTRKNFKALTSTQTLWNLNDPRIFNKKVRNPIFEENRKKKVFQFNDFEVAFVVDGSVGVVAVDVT